MTKVLLFFLTISIVFSQRFEDGIPFIKNYSTSDYQADLVNRDIIQDSKGIIYFANSAGLLSFDGIRWETTTLGYGKGLRSFDIDKDDNIYIGSIEDFGVFKRNEKGELLYTSFRSLLDSTVTDIRDVWYTFVTEDAVYFQSRKYIFKYQNNEIKVYTTKRYPTHTLHKINNEVFTRREDKGLALIGEDTLKTIPNGDFFEFGNSPFVMLPKQEGYLFGTRKYGLFTFENDEPKLFNEALNEELKAAQIYRGYQGTDNKYYISTLQNGIYQFEQDGTFINNIGKESGLFTSDIKTVYETKDKSFWVGMEDGIARINYSSAFRFFDERSGMTELPKQSFRFKGILYISTNNGVMYWNNDHFEKVIGTKNSTHSFEVIRNELYVAGESAIFKITGNRAKSIGEANGLYDISYSKEHRTTFVSGPTGARLLDHRTDKNVLISEVKGRVNSMHRLDDSSFFLTVNNGTLLKLTITGFLKYKIEETKSEDKINFYARFFYWQDKLYVTTPGHLYYIDGLNVIKDSVLTSYLPDHFKAPFMTKDFGDNLILLRGENFGILKKTEDGYKYYDKSFKLIYDYYNVTEFYMDNDQSIWLTTNKGLLNYRPELDNLEYSKANVSISKMIINTDSILQQSIHSNMEIRSDISYDLNKVRFEFGAANYDRPDLTLFRYRLIGNENEWSNWSKENYVDLSNLFEGSYNFELQSKDVFGVNSEVLSIKFSIIAPFYRSYIAYIFYLFILIYLIRLLVKSRIAVLEREKEKLELIVEERTQKIQQQAEKLKELDRAKTKFFTNISHEIRTPLTLMLSPLEDVIPQISDEKIQNKLSIVKRNTSRLFQLITQILDISKIESRSLPINMIKGDVIPLVRELISSFAGVTDKRDIKVELELNSPKILAYVDQDKFEKIFFNIFSNAVKNSPNSSKLNVSLGKSFQKFDLINTDTHYLLSIEDQGEGIPEDQIEQIFERYYQVETTESQKAIGSGIGLSLVKELVELLHGRIRVHSKEGKGTIFEIFFPIDESLFPESDIRSHEIHDFTKQNAEFYFNYDIGVTPELKKELKSSEIKKETQIVIIEDNIELNSYLKQFFEHYFTVHSADNGESGLTLIKEVVPDLIISDVMMPKKDGYELTKDVRTNPELDHIPVILLTAKSASEERIEGLEYGANDYVTKPFNAKELQLRIQNILSYRDKLRDKYDNNILLEPSEFTENTQEEAFLNHANEIIENHLSDAEFSVDDFCKEIGMSRTNLHRKLKYLTNKSTTDYIRSVKLKLAVNLLINKAGTISEIAYQAGFNSVSYFNKIFKATFNKSPKEFLQSYEA